jgi:S-adenosylmethionine:tRNA ribosyltransferase-isomerase
MIAADEAVQRPARAKLLVYREDGNIEHWRRSRFIEVLRKGDLVVANDAATLPASLLGKHQRTGQPIEVRLAGGHLLPRTTSGSFLRSCLVQAIFEHARRTAHATFARAR